MKHTKKVTFGVLTSVLLSSVVTAGIQLDPPSHLTNSLPISLNTIKQNPLKKQTVGLSKTQPIAYFKDVKEVSVKGAKSVLSGDEAQHASVEEKDTVDASSILEKTILLQDKEEDSYYLASLFATDNSEQLHGDKEPALANTKYWGVFTPASKDEAMVLTMGSLVCGYVGSSLAVYYGILPALELATMGTAHFLGPIGSMLIAKKTAMYTLSGLKYTGGGIGGTFGGYATLLAYKSGKFVVKGVSDQVEKTLFVSSNLDSKSTKATQANILKKKESISVAGKTSHSKKGKVKRILSKLKSVATKGGKALKKTFSLAKKKRAAL